MLFEFFSIMTVKLPQTNEQLDDVLKQMQALNPSLEKICGQIDKFNHKFLKVK